MAYDSKCFDLAKVFLFDLYQCPVPKEKIEDLAQQIQDTIEDFLVDERAELEKKDD